MNSAWLEFEHAYAKKYDPFTDSLIVYLSDDCGESWSRLLAKGEDGSGNFATHELTDDFWPETASDWCGNGWGASCTSIDLSNWTGQADIRIAFESYSTIGNPLFIDNISISTYVGEEETRKEPAGLKVFPNPANGAFKVFVPESEEGNTFRIINPMGQTVYYREIKKEGGIIEMNQARNWSPGIYFLSIRGKNTSLSGKLVVE
jgi:hypothetical protein